MTGLPTLDVGPGPINGVGSGAMPSRGTRLPLVGRSRRKRNAARRALDRKAREPLPGADGG